MKILFYLLALLSVHYAVAQKTQRFEIAQAHWLIVGGLVHFDEQGNKTDTVYTINGIDSQSFFGYNTIASVATGTIHTTNVNYVILHEGKLSDLLLFLKTAQDICTTEEIGVCIVKNGNKFCVEKRHTNRALVIYPFHTTDDKPQNDYMLVLDNDTLPWCTDTIKKWAKKHKVTIS
ncbi:MAG TPA: hypothetical protein VK750_02610 [Cytophagaceae bacterium]|jgi:hypothetical protein|nr:hypothetical protein [Cytophagaceae bacterium]